MFKTLAIKKCYHHVHNNNTSDCLSVAWMGNNLKCAGINKHKTTIEDTNKQKLKFFVTYTHAHIDMYIDFLLMVSIVSYSQYKLFLTIPVY